MEDGLTDDLKVTLQGCLKQIIFLREKHDEACRLEKLALVDLLNSWTRLKLIRVKNGFISTPFNLILHARKRDRSRDLDAYQQDIEDELLEKEMLFMLDSVENQRQHQEDLEKWEKDLQTWHQAQDTVGHTEENGTFTLRTVLPVLEYEYCVMV